MAVVFGDSSGEEEVFLFGEEVGDALVLVKVQKVTRLDLMVAL